MQIRHYSIIRPCTKDVKKFDQALLDIKKEMQELCERTNGIGLSASQVGLEERLFIFQRENGNWVLVCNPKMVPQKNEGLQRHVEGCLSVPNEAFEVRRWAKVNASWQDENGNFVEEELSGRNAQVFQHEFDHLVARSIVDRAKSQYRSSRFEASRQKKKKSKK